MNECTRKLSSFVMLPVMSIYLFGAEIAQGSQIISPTSQNKTNSSPAANEESIDDIAKRANNLSRLKSDSSSGASASNSQASNSGVTAEVNSQTGQINLTLTVLNMPGITQEMNLNITAVNSGTSKQVYNMPSGWSLSLPYIDVLNNKLYMSNNQNYPIDSNGNYESGLRYYTLKDINFTQGYGKFHDSEYYYKLKKLSGLISYFDFNGKFIGYEDKYGNYITFSYTQVDSGRDFTAFNAQLSQIRDTLGHIVNLSAAGSAENWSITYTVTLPDSSKTTMECEDNVLTIIGTTGKITKVKFENGHLTQIDYELGGRETYEWSETAIPYSYNNLSSTGYLAAVISVTKDPTPGSPESGDEIITSYNYCPEGGNNYTGYGAVDFDSGVSQDALMESMDPSYSYKTEVTQHRSAENGGPLKVQTEYNFLHLPMRSVTYSSSSSAGSNSSMISEKVYKYIGQNNGDGQFPADLQNLVPNYSKQKLVTSTVYSSSQSSGGQKTTVQETDYNDYGLKTLDRKYNGNNPVSEIVTEYADNYGMIKKETLTDYTNIGNGAVTTYINTLSSDGKYIASHYSTASSVNSRITDSVIDSSGRSISTTVRFADSKNDEANTPTTSTSTNEYSTDGDNISVTTVEADGSRVTQVTNIITGAPVSKTDANGNKTTYVVENKGLTITEVYPDGSLVKADQSEPGKSVTTHSSGIVFTSYYDGFGNILRETDNLGPNKTERTLKTCSYNEMGKMKEESDSLGRTKKYTYADTQGRPTSLVDSYGNILTSTYDDVALTATAFFNGQEVSTTFYDDQNNILQSLSYISGAPDNASTPVVVSQYNGKNQEITNSLIFTAGQPSSSSANAASEYTMTRAYTPEGLPTSLDLTTNDGGQVKTIYTASLFGDLIQSNTVYSAFPAGITDNDHSISSEVKTYNSKGQLIKLTNQFEKSIEYTYDPAGNLKTMKDFSGNVFTYSYNNMNKMISIAWQDGGIDWSIENEYYPPGNIAESQIKTKSLRKGFDTISQITYGFNELGQASAITYKDSSGETKSSMTFDHNGRLTSNRDFAGIETTVNYENPNFPANVTSVSNINGWAKYTYVPANSGIAFNTGDTVSSVEYSNGVKINYKYYDSKANSGYSKASLLESVSALDSSNKMLSSYSYKYDNSARITEIIQTSETADPTDINFNNRKVYKYNGTGQLLLEQVYNLSGNSVYTTSFTYDALLNITNKTITDSDGKVTKKSDYTYEKRVLLTKITESEKGISKVFDFTYDDNGNMIAISSNGKLMQQYSYNTVNQLKQFKDLDYNLDVSYDYYPDYLRKSKYLTSDGSVKLTFLYSGGGSIENELDGKGNISNYLVGHDKILRAVGDAVEYYIKNHKDVTATVDSTGNKTLNNYQYTAYGEEVDLNKKEVLNNQKIFDIKNNPFKYSSYYGDSESGMYYVKNRYYSPKLMRFISRDSHDLSNRYAYCSGSPISNIDPTGNSLWDMIALGVTLVLAVATSVIPGSQGSWLLVAYEASMMSVNTVSAVKDGVNHDWVAFGADMINIASSAVGGYSAQPTLFKLGNAGEQAKALLRASEAVNAPSKWNIFGKSSLKTDWSGVNVADNYIKALNKHETLNIISTYGSQTSVGLASGLNNSYDHEKHEWKSGGDIAAAIGLSTVGSFLGAISYKMVSDKLPAMSASGYSASANKRSYLLKAVGLSTIRSGSAAFVQQSFSVGVTEIQNPNKLTTTSYWTSQLLNLAIGTALGGVSGITQMGSAINTAGRAGLAWKASRVFYLDLKAPIISKLLDNKISEYGNFSWHDKESN